MEWMSVCFGLLQIFHHLHGVLSFNLYTEGPIIKDGLHDSYFGFSVAQHIKSTPSADGQSLVQEHLLLVGAPKDNITDFDALPELRNLRRPGAVYSCPVSSFRDDCTQVRLMRNRLSNREDRSEQWLGVSVASQGTAEGLALACAHRYRIQDYSANYIRGPGLCISISNSLDEEEYFDPCENRARSSQRGHSDYAFCATGTSAALNDDGKFLLGVPGVYNWHGEVMKNIIELSLTESQQWYESAHIDEEDRDEDTQPIALTHYYSYLGMSVAFGRLINNRVTYIAGAPRSEDVGQVYLFQERNQNYIDANKLLEAAPDRILTGEQFGSCFGYSLAVLDLNNDRYQDLVVGAPFYHGDGVGGVIYIYMSTRNGVKSDTEPIRIDSRKMPRQECTQLNCENARFGFSLANAGDIDRDGYEDLAVGAPFEGDGVVYIFRGSENGIMREHSQRIAASEIETARPLTSFGYSLAGGKDMDENTYPDLVVGAYSSAKTLILRARPVVNVQVKVASIPGTIKVDPENERCEGDGRPNTCFKLRLCFNFTAEPREQFSAPLNVDYTLVGETFTGRTRSRVFFRGAPDPHNQHIMERSIKVKRTTPGQSCGKEDDLLVYITNGNTDRLNPIHFQLTYRLKEVAPPVMNEGDPLPDLNTYPVLNRKTSVYNHSVEFFKDCGVDETCNSQLRLDANFDLETDGDVQILRLGQDEEPVLNIYVDNRNGDEAHETTLYVELPAELKYRGVTEEGKKYSCLPVEQTVVCLLGNPLLKNEAAEFGIRLDPENLSPALREISVTIKVNTTSKETDETNDSRSIKLRVVVETDLLVRGISDPDSEYFGGQIVGESAIRYEDDIGKQIVHMYEVKNAGKGKVGNSTVWISWPYEVENNYPQGKHLLYLMDQPMIEYENGTIGYCQIDDRLVNPLDITKRPDRQRPRDNTSSQPVEERSVRVKRDSVVAYDTVRDSDTGKAIKVVTLNCERRTAKCFKFPCVIESLSSGSGVVISLRSRLWNSTFLEDYTDVNEVRIGSKAEIHIDERQNVKQTTLQNDVAYAVTRAIPDIQVKEKEGVPLWVIIVAVCAGILLLVLIIILLWKCGFFKRKTADDMRKHKANVEKQKHTKKTGKKQNKDYYN